MIALLEGKGMSVSMRLGRRSATRRPYPVAVGAEHWLTRVLPLDKPREGGGLFGPCARADCITDEGSSQTRSGRSVHDLLLDEIRAARERIGGVGTDSPLVRLDVDDVPAEIYLKLENLQPIGSFKLRGGWNLLQLTDRRDLRKGVWTANAGNMAQGVAWFDTLGR